MNDLQPWKICAVTVALVCAILGSTAARLRPQPSAEASMLSTAVTSDEHPTRVTTASYASNDNQNDAYAFNTPHRSFYGAGYRGGMAGPIAPVNNLLYGSASASALQAEEYPEPVVDVTQEITGSNQDSQPDLVAANEGQPSQIWDLPLFYAAGDQVREDIFADVPQDHWAYGSVQDASQMLTFTIPPPEASGFVVLDQPVPMDTPVNDLALRNVVLTVAINGSDSNGAMNVVNAINGYVVTGIPPTITDGEAVNLPLNLAMSGEFNVELGDEQEDRVKARSEELLVEAQAQLQAAQQQRAEAIYTATLGRLYAVKNGAALADQPEESMRCWGSGGSRQPYEDSHLSPKTLIELSDNLRRFPEILRAVCCGQLGPAKSTTQTTTSNACPVPHVPSDPNVPCIFAALRETNLPLLQPGCLIEIVSHNASNTRDLSTSCDACSARRTGTRSRSK